MWVKLKGELINTAHVITVGVCFSNGAPPARSIRMVFADGSESFFNYPTEKEAKRAFEIFFDEVRDPIDIDNEMERYNENSKKV